MAKILIIEDEEPIRRVLVRILTEEDSSFDVHEAIDGKDGLKKLDNNHFDLVLCDIKMPKCDGIEVLEKVKVSKKNTSIYYANRSRKCFNCCRSNEVRCL